MRDIVERLRQPHLDEMEETEKLLQEAADEIELLRKGLAIEKSSVHPRTLTMNRDPFRLLSIAVIMIGVGLCIASVSLAFNSWSIWRLEQQINELRKP